MSFYNETVGNLQAIYNQQHMNQMYGQGPNYYAMWKDAENRYIKASDELSRCRKELDNYKNKLIKIKAALAARQKARDEIIGELEGI
jgi:hypothetical protein